MFVLPDLPYPYEALEPTMSAETLRFHHDKHHAAYVKALNELVGDTAKTLEEVTRTAGPGKPFNNAAQAWNHAFFWDSMTPDRTSPEGALAGEIDKAFGGVAALKDAFVKEGVGHFASGWVWLVAEAGGLKVISTHDADNTLTKPNVTPLLVCDLWEHAYYIDKRNDRKAFLEGWFDALPNWKLAARQLAAARGQGDAWSYPPPA